MGLWIGVVWNGVFQSPKTISFRGLIFRMKIPEFTAERFFLLNFRLLNSNLRAPKNAIPYPQPLHTLAGLPPNFSNEENYQHEFPAYARFWLRENKGEQEEEHRLIGFCPSVVARLPSSSMTRKPAPAFGTPMAWHKCQNGQHVQKCLRRVQKVFSGLWAQSPKTVCCTARRLFPPSAKQDLHSARDSFGTLGPETPNHCSILLEYLWAFWLF